jgi:WD40 repeat protein
MLALRFSIAFVIALVVNLAATRGEEMPDQKPFLSIESGMHTTVIRSVSVSADGKLIATASEDKTARLWSLPEGKLLKTFRVPVGEGSAGKLNSVALSPDGGLLAAGGLDAYVGQHAFIYVFDAVSGAELGRLGPLPEVTLKLAFSPDGRWLAAGLGGNYGIRLWNVESGFAEDKSDRSYRSDVYDIAFDGKDRMATASYDGNVRVYRLPDKPKGRLKLLKKRKAPDGANLFSVAFSPDGEMLAVGYTDTASVSIIDSTQLKPVPDFNVATGFAVNGALSNVSWSSDGETLFAGGTYLAKDGNPLVAWSDKGRGQPHAVHVFKGSIFDIAPLQDGTIAYATAEPSFGVTNKDSDGFKRSAVTANLIPSSGERFASAQDAIVTWFTYNDYQNGGLAALTFDTQALSVEPAKERPAGLISANTDRLPVEHWDGYFHPSINGRELEIKIYEASRSLAIAPDALSFIIGAEWTIYRFAANGDPIWNVSVPGPAWGVNISADGSIVIVALGDGTIRWYRAADGKELLALFVNVADKRWIAWTPSGYYAASPGAEDLIGWHVNGKTWDDTPQFYPASRFRDQFYRPDVVQFILKAKDELTAIAAADLVAGRKEEKKTVEELLPASVELLLDAPEIQTAQKEITVKYRLASQTGRAVTRVEARIDGRPVVTRGMEVLTDDFPLGQVLEAHITVPSRDSELSILAYIGDQPSVAATAPIKWTGATAIAPKAKLFALLVGVSAYANPSLKLNYAAKDAADFAKALSAQKGQLYESVTIVELLDGNASKSAVETALARLKKDVGPEDTAVVFLAGHGVTDKQFDFYYLTADADTDPAMLSATAIDGDNIRKTLSQVAGRVVLFMDACRSGAGIAGKVDMNRLSNDFAQDTGGLVMFASSQGREDSLESSAWENGAFTEAMLAILDDGNAYGADKQLSIPELEEALTIRVRELTEDRQSPVMTKYGAIPRFFIAATQ